MLIGIEKLTCLQTLPHFVVNRDHNCLLGQLERLNNLRGRLHLYGLSDMSNMEEASKAKLCRKSNIQRLLLDWSSNGDERDHREYNDEDVMEGLKPHTNLKKLTKVKFKGVTFASWIPMMTSLVRITLRDCNRFEGFPPLGHLPKLREMEMNKMNNVKVEVLMVGSCSKFSRIPSNSFTSFKMLEIINLDSSIILETMSRHISSLTHLRMWNVSDRGRGSSSSSNIEPIDMLLKSNTLSLTTLGLCDCQGLKSLTLGVALKVLQVSSCPDLSSINVVGELSGLKYLRIEKCSSLSEWVFVQSMRSTLVRLTFGPFLEESEIR